MPDRKILIVTNRVPYPYKDGGNIAMHAMIEGYHSAGWQVYLLSMNTTRHQVDEKKLAGLYPDLHAFEWVAIDNRVRTIGVIKNYLFSKEPEHAKRFYHTLFNTKLIEICRSFKPDVVQFESIFLSSYLPAVRDNTNAVTVLRMHNVEYRYGWDWQRNLATVSNSFIWKAFRAAFATMSASAGKSMICYCLSQRKDAAQVKPAGRCKTT